MTIITAISDGTSVWLGNNTAVTIGDTPVNHSFDPWVKFGNWALGITGDSYQQDLLNLNSKELERNSNTPLELMQFIRELFLENDISINDDDHASPSFGIWSILANKKEAFIWDVDHRLSLTLISKNKLWASGSGVDFALGADFSCLKLEPNKPLSERILLATNAAIFNDINCPGEATVSQFT